MVIRVQTGIQLPESLLAEAVMISISETSQPYSTTDNTAKIIAWGSVDNRDYVEFVPKTKGDEQSTAPYTVPTNSEDDRFFQIVNIVNIVNSFEYNLVAANEELSDSICSCNL
jgi:hypothetical protein